MARDRQKAKQRRAARKDANGSGVPAPSEPQRTNVNPDWEHGGEVDRVEAELVAGAGGQTADDVSDAELEQEAVAEVGDLDGDGKVDAADLEVLHDTAGTAGGAGGRIDDVGHLDDDDAAYAEGERTLPAAGRPGATAVGARRDATVTPTAKGFGRFGAFLAASWAELQRVQWPDRRQVGQATAVVMGFVVIAGAYLGIADAVAKQIVDFIL